MSHATVLVILKKDDDLNEVMAPYDENNEDAFEFEDRTEELLECYEEDIKEAEERGESVSSVLVDSWGYTEKDGRFGSFYNPQGYWDWFTVGGRWEGFLKLNKEIKNPEDVIECTEEGTHCNGCRSEDFDYEGQKKELKQDALFFAVLKDGQWYGSAELGWFGTTSNENEDWPAMEAKLLKECDPKDQLVLVDYHI